MRTIHQRRSDHAMLFGVAGVLLLLLVGHIALLVFVGTHLWAVALAHEYHGFWQALLTFFLPVGSHVYWMHHWPQIASAAWPHPLEDIAGRNWFVWLNWFWMLAFLCVGFFATLSPRVLPPLAKWLIKWLGIGWHKIYCFAQKAQQILRSLRRN